VGGASMTLWKCGRR